MVKPPMIAPTFKRSSIKIYAKIAAKATSRRIKIDVTVAESAFRPIFQRK